MGLLHTVAHGTRSTGTPSFYDATSSTSGFKRKRNQRELISTVNYLIPDVKYVALTHCPLIRPCLIATGLGSVVSCIPRKEKRTTQGQTVMSPPHLFTSPFEVISTCCDAFCQLILSYDKKEVI